MTGGTNYPTESNKTVKVGGSVLQGRKGNLPGHAVITHEDRPWISSRAISRLFFLDCLNFICYFTLLIKIGEGGLEDS
jgi:hypothetical protein